MKPARVLGRAALLLGLLVLIPVLMVALSSRIGPDQRPPIPPTLDENAIKQRITKNWQTGRPMQALYQIESLAAQTGWTADLQQWAGDLWRELGDLDAAAAYWQAAADKTLDAGLLRQTAQAYIDLQRWTDAMSVLGQLTVIAPNDRWGHYQMGLIQAAYDPPAAKAHMQIALESRLYNAVSEAVLNVLNDYAADPLIGMHIGITLARYELWPYAEIAFQHAAAVGYPYPEAMAYVGMARDRQGKDGGEWIQQAVTLAPQNSQVRYLQGLHLRAAGQYEPSLNALGHALALDPKNPALCAELSTAYRLLGNLPQAEYWLQTAVEVSGNDPRFQNLLALFYAEEAPSLTSSGLDMLRQTAMLLPNDPDVKAGFGWALYQTGETEAGLAEIEAALKIAHDNPRALFYKASILLDTDKQDEAIPLLRRVAEQNSVFADDARKILQNLGY